MAFKFFPEKKFKLIKDLTDCGLDGEGEELTLDRECLPFMFGEGYLPWMGEGGVTYPEQVMP